MSIDMEEVVIWFSSTVNGSALCWIVPSWNGAEINFDFDLISQKFDFGFDFYINSNLHIHWILPPDEQKNCKGDSGGPLVVRDQLGQYVQVGITSFGASGLEGLVDQKTYPALCSEFTIEKDRDRLRSRMLVQRSNLHSELSDVGLDDSLVKERPDKHNSTNPQASSDTQIGATI
ncbi:hypothetical protein WR25_20408 [Diploscapter pachys]|uniref:Peptidase S1 domain-containing protein n=1 Tax=Diploscapter pachys TaxID=2018661 RepID=A0A2A2JLV3_9BILA|nr:hypothetical protein WR25_20408 [Diploscapter pachys]